MPCHGRIQKYVASLSGNCEGLGICHSLKHFNIDLVLYSTRPGDFDCPCQVE
jgi:hypothetical protein